MEHRWGHRITLDLPVIVAHGAKTAAARLCNASSSGGFVATRMRLPLWTQIDVRLVPLRAGEKSASIPAAIVRARHDGFGVEWVEFAPDDIRALLTRTPAAAQTPLSAAMLRAAHALTR